MRFAAHRPARTARPAIAIQRAKGAAKLLLPATALLLVLTPFHSAAPGAAATNGSVKAPTTIVPEAPGGVTSVYRPEVRLRKLHLVRPDLIPYPLAYDVYC